MKSDYEDRGRAVTLSATLLVAVPSQRRVKIVGGAREFLNGGGVGEFCLLCVGRHLRKELGEGHSG